MGKQLDRLDRRSAFILACAGLAVTTLSLTGCSRRYHRRDADQQVREILSEKDACEPYDLPADFNVYPDPRARFNDHADPDCPVLPNPWPTLNQYQLPPLVSGNPAASDLEDGTTVEEPATGDPSAEELPEPAAASSEELPTGTAESEEDDTPADSADRDAGGLRIVPIPQATWEDIPDVCLPRMIEFASVREEYQRSYAAPVPANLASDAPRLSLPNVMELALINSREYQTRKEILYQVALRLTRQRFEFQLRPSQFGNGTAANYRSLNSAGRQVNTLGVPTQAVLTQTTATAGQFLASFANNVLLTFNGPQGFAADVNSEILFDFQQTIFQRDIVFEQLTQAERDVIYASRDLIRFRRQLFRDLASQYYNLLLSYRAIEIASQDYFSNLRGYLQGQAEYEFRGGLPRVQVDQFEQNALRSRSDLVSRCNQLETQLDRLKLAVGLPPEMPLNLALAELEALSASDESTVARELISRARRELVSQKQRRQSDLTALVNAASVLINRIEDIRNLSQQLETSKNPTPSDNAQPPASESQQNDNQVSERRYLEVASQLAVLEAKSRVDALRGELAQDQENDTALLALQVFGRNVELTSSVLELARRLIRYRRLTGGGDPLTQLTDDPAAGLLTTPPTERLGAARDYLAELSDELTAMEVEFSDLEAEATLLQLPSYVERAETLLRQADQLLDALAAGIIPTNPAAYAKLIDQTVDETIQLATESITASGGGLGEIEVAEEAAMLTALVQRLDLRNRRGELADSRRQVKFTADDLRSIFDLRATQILRSPGDVNQPFNFSFDDSETRLSIALDTPLNRRQQRNNYRAALINYNRAIRTLIEAEDNVKFEIRDNLRGLRLRRDQYEIGVKSAALAFERVSSTRLQLQLATGDVVARDFLEAQQAYTAALSSVASQHIGFILDRVELFFDLEAIRLDQVGYWPGLLDEEMQPPVDTNFFENNPRPYGRLVPHLKYSPEIRKTVR